MADDADTLPDASRATQLLAAIWTPFPFALFFLAARFYARIVRKRLRSDDWLMLLATACYAVFAGIATAAFALGGARHAVFLRADASRLSTVLEFQTLMEYFGALSLLFGKASVALLLPHLVPKIAVWQLSFLAVHMAIYTLLTAAYIIVSATQCTPAWAMWHPAELHAHQATCPRTNATNILMTATLAFGAYLNVALVLLPISVLFNLRSSRHKRVAIACLILCGIFAAACGIGQAVAGRRYHFTADRTWDIYGLVIWTALQMPLFIIAGSIPPAKPLLDALLRPRRLSFGPAVAPPPLQSSSATALTSPRKWSFLGGTDRGASSVTVPELQAGILMEKRVAVERASTDEGGRVPVAQTFAHDERWALSPEDVQDKI